MSFLSKAWKSVRSVVAPVIGTAVGGPVGGALGSLLGGSGSRGAVPAPSLAPMPSAMPGAGFQPAAFALPALPALGGAAARLAPAVIGGAVRVASSARRIAAGAASICRRNPQWCATIGGLAAVEALMRSGQLPVPKRRRGRGITATELRAFKRVAKFTSKYCAPVRRAMSAPAVRGSKCR